MIEHALRYARLGLPIVPLEERAKQRYVLAPTSDAQTLERYWAAHPAANVGLALGRASGLVMLDLDGSPNVGPLPPTACVRTARGWHVFFQNSPELARVFDTVARMVDELCRSLGVLGSALSKLPLSKLGLAAGVELLGERCTTPLPPSVHPWGSVYAFADCGPEALLAPAPPPDWLVRAAEDALTHVPAECAAIRRVVRENENLAWLI